MKTPNRPLSLSDFHFELPSELIAQNPAPERSSSRLLFAQSKKISHHTFRNLAELLAPKDLLVFNDTKVIQARLAASKETGGQCEILVERIFDKLHFKGQLRASHQPHVDDYLFVTPDIKIQVGLKEGPFFHFRLIPHSSKQPFSVPELLTLYGQLPLPPYIKKKPQDQDFIRYQTIYAQKPGSVAAPTAGLHFDNNVFASLQKKGVAIAYLTLHIGAGTFAPIRTENLNQHTMHQEQYSIPAETIAMIHKTKQQGGRVIAVGTTTLRALESAAQASAALEPTSGAETSIFIQPGFTFQIVDGLITNFHLPSSSLFMLVCAFLGLEAAQNAYQQAIIEKYRFYSYGDAMLALKNPGNTT